MYTFRLSYRRVFLGILLLAQAALILTFIYLQLNNTDDKIENGKISFLKNSHLKEEFKITYHTIVNKFILKTISTRENFIDFNSSVCYKNGTDLQSMNHTNQQNWKCNCLTGWHGNNCGLPEVFWRAALANKKSISLKGPRIFERRIIYIFEVDIFSENIVDIRINELGNIIDLFILFEDRESNYLENKLNDNFLKEYHDKILYVKGKLYNIWKGVKNLIKNIRSDDLILTSNSSEILSKTAISFLKYYDNWFQPIRFRLRWSVYGFFWKHPSKTIITGGACTIAYLKQNLDDRLDYLLNNKTLSNSLHKGIILGDLNHFGGWFCELCNDASKIVEHLKNKSKNMNWEKLTSKVDHEFIEELIGNGLYIDSKTELIRAHRYSDNYFAPKSVSDSTWKYDFLFINFYSKLDYYEE